METRSTGVGRELQIIRKQMASIVCGSHGRRGNSCGGQALFEALVRREDWGCCDVCPVLVPDEISVWCNLQANVKRNQMTQ